jgi:predicted secreted protein
MANPTTNFGWVMPTSTSLVTNLPADFNTFGQAVDTSMAQLKGGTTGQILSKTSATDMAFTWITNDVGDITAVTAGTGISGGGTSGAVTITNSMATEITAKGDLIVGTGSATFDNLAAGANGETLVADSSTSTGLRWQGSQAAGKNYCINGGFDIWQRGTSSTSNGAYNSADRWWLYYGAGTSTFSQESTIVPTGSTYSLKVAQSVATNTNLQILQSIESLNAVALAGKTVTISGLFAASTSTTLTIDVVYSTATNVAPSGAWTGATTVTAGTGTVSTTASFSRITGVYTIPSTAKSVMARVTSSSVASGTSVYIAQVQLEIGSVPTTFTLTGGTIQGELSACQRYYERLITNGQNISLAGFNTSTTVGYATWAYKTSKRINPTITMGTAASDFAIRIPGGSNAGLTAYSVIGNTLDNAWLSGTTSGLTSGNGNLLVNVGNNGYLEASAEL